MAGGVMKKQGGGGRGRRRGRAQPMAEGALNAGGFSNIGLVTENGGPKLDGTGASGG